MASKIGIRSVRRAFAPLALAVGVTGLGGCWSPLGADEAAGEGGEPAAQEAAGAEGNLLDALAAGTQPLSGDLVSPGHAEGDLIVPAGEELLQAPGDPGTGGAPKVFYLAYADGGSILRGHPNPCKGTPPRFVCDFAPTLVECQRQIQSYLDRWYADFNVVFTLTRPSTGTFYTEVISSGGGAWCDAAANVAGVAPFLCDDLQGGVAYTFMGGKTAKETAIIIAQEQGHLVGLEHTQSRRDVMDPTICSNCDGFEDVENRIQNDHCNRGKQNSHQLMKERLGAWTGGIKPTPFGCQPDDAPPMVQILTPGDDATVASNFVLRVQASDACKVTRVSVAVAPLGLSAQSTAPPYEWTLTRISGRQTITVTAEDGSGKKSKSVITVRAGSASTGTGGTGGTVGGGGTAGPGGTGGTGGVGGPSPGMGGAGPDGGSMSPAEIGTRDTGGCQLGGCVVGGASGPGELGWWLSTAALLSAIAFSVIARKPTPSARTRPR